MVASWLKTQKPGNNVTFKGCHQVFSIYTLRFTLARWCSWYFTGNVSYSIWFSSGRIGCAFAASNKGIPAELWGQHGDWSSFKSQKRCMKRDNKKALLSVFLAAMGQPSASIVDAPLLFSPDVREDSGLTSWMTLSQSSKEFRQIHFVGTEKLLKVWSPLLYGGHTTIGCRSCVDLVVHVRTTAHQPIVVWKLCRSSI